MRHVVINIRISLHHDERRGIKRLTRVRCSKQRRLAKPNPLFTDNKGAGYAGAVIGPRLARTRWANPPYGLFLPNTKLVKSRSCAAMTEK